MFWEKNAYALVLIVRHEEHMCVCIRKQMYYLCNGGVNLFFGWLTNQFHGVIKWKNKYFLKRLLCVFFSLSSHFLWRRLESSSNRKSVHLRVVLELKERERDIKKKEFFRTRVYFAHTHDLRTSLLRI